MKKIHTIILLLVFTSCQNLFQEENDKYLLLDNTEEMADLINGIYYYLTQVHNSDYFYLLCRADDINFYYKYSSVNIDGTKCSLNSNPPDYSFKAKSVYINLYMAITTANRLLDELSATEDPYITGEVYFLRAYCYFKLARFFGTPPLVEDVDVSYSIERPGFAEVYEFIESDMLNAIDLLPDTYTKARIPGETPHKGAAKALLAEIYLAWAGYPVNDDSKYALAAQLAGEVIENAANYNFALINDLANLWNSSFRHNTENVFGLFYGEESETQNNINNSEYQSFSSYYTNYLPGFTFTFIPEIQFFLDFPNNYRKKVTLMDGSYSLVTYSDIDSSFTAIEYSPFDPINYFCNYKAGYLKWCDREGINIHFENVDSPGSSITLYILRYAQTLLTYAEAKARSGNLDASCYEAVNMVRRRANKLDTDEPSEYDIPSGLSTEQFLDSVVWERAWELCFEPEGRWFDILRLDYRDKLSEFRYENDYPNSISSKYLTDDWYFFLIPAADRIMNPNLEY